MSNQSKREPVWVQVPGELWPQFAVWAAGHRYRLQEVDDDHVRLEYAEPVDDMPRPGPWT